MIAHLNQPVPTFFSVAPDLVVPSGLEEIVRKCLSKNPNDRYATMADLMNALAGCMNIPPEQFRSVSQSHSTIQKQLAIPSNGRRKGLVVVGLVAALMFVGVGVIGTALAVMQPWASPPPVERNLADAPISPPPVVAAPVVADEGTADPVEEPVVEEPVVEEPIVEAKEEPKVVVKRRPKPRKPKAVVAPDPPVEEDKPEVKPDEEEQPTGYMGMPDDF
jgi:hypothetical protein